MAPAIISTSNSFLLTTTPHSRFSRRSLPRLTVLAKKKQTHTPNSKPFRFNFSSFSDFKSLIPVISNPSPGLSFGTILRRKDPGTVFVAGATGQAGIRIAQTLLREGFKVRSGVKEHAAAQELRPPAPLTSLLSDRLSVPSDRHYFLTVNFEKGPSCKFLRLPLRRKLLVWLQENNMLRRWGRPLSPLRFVLLQILLRADSSWSWFITISTSDYPLITHDVGIGGRL